MVIQSGKQTDPGGPTFGCVVGFEYTLFHSLPDGPSLGFESRPRNIPNPSNPYHQPEWARY